MAEPKTVADVLRGAAALIEPAGAWTRGGTRLAGGELTWPGDIRAASFCAFSAISRASGDSCSRIASGARDALRRAVGLSADDSISDWGDVPERTQAEVVQALRDAASLAEGEAGRG